MPKKEVAPSENPKYVEDAKKAETAQKQQKGENVPDHHGHQPEEFTPMAYQGEKDLQKVVITCHSVFVAEDERAFKDDKVMVPESVALALEEKRLATIV